MIVGQNSKTILTDKTDGIYKYSNGIYKLKIGSNSKAKQVYTGAKRPYFWTRLVAFTNIKYSNGIYKLKIGSNSEAKQVYTGAKKN